MAKENLSLTVARACLERCKSQEAYNGKGVKRDRACLEFIAGAAAVLIATTENTKGVECTNAAEALKSVNLLGYMVSIRGHAFLVEHVEKAST